MAKMKQPGLIAAERCRGGINENGFRMGVAQVAAPMYKVLDSILAQVRWMDIDPDTLLEARSLIGEYADTDEDE